MSIFIQALYSIFICYLLPVLSSILSSFQFLLFFFTSLISFDEQQSNNNNILDEQKLGFETIFARHPYSLFSSGYAPWYNQLFTNSNIYIYIHTYISQLRYTWKFIIPIAYWLSLRTTYAYSFFLIDQNPPTHNQIILDVIKLCLSFNQDHMSISNFLSVFFLLSLSLSFFLLNTNRSFFTANIYTII